MADASGNWSITSAVLGDGPHALTATQTDLAGNTGVASTALTVTVTAPKTAIYVLQGFDPVAIAAAPFDVKVIGLYDDTGQPFAADRSVRWVVVRAPESWLATSALVKAELISRLLRDHAGGDHRTRGLSGFRAATRWRIGRTSGSRRNQLHRQDDRAGFDGVVFDVVDAGQTCNRGPRVPPRMAMPRPPWPVWSRHWPATPSGRPGFSIWVNGGELLLSDSIYLQAINGVFKESSVLCTGPENTTRVRNELQPGLPGKGHRRGQGRHQYRVSVGSSADR